MNPDNISLEHLIFSNALSERAINVCKRAELLSLDNILAYYQKFGSFKQIKNCGPRTELELKSLCNKHQDIRLIPIVDLQDISNNPVEKPCAPDVPIEENPLNPFKRDLFSRHLASTYYRLLPITRRLILKNAKTKSIKELPEIIISHNFDAVKIFGTETLNNLNDETSFIKNAAEYYNYIQSQQDHDLGKEYLALIIKEHFKEVPELIFCELSSAIDSAGKIKLFQLLNLLIRFDLLYDLRDKKIADFLFNCPTSTFRNLAEIRVELSITRERTRQIHRKIEKNTIMHCQFISRIPLEYYFDYEIHNEAIIKAIDESIVEEINTNEGVNFNQHFFSIILRLLLNNEHTILGHDETVNEIGKRGDNNDYKCHYLIRNDFFAIFKYENFVKDLYRRIHSRITATYSMNFEEYLFEFLNKEHYNQIKDVCSICETIILREFNLLLSDEEHLVFKRNEKKSKSEIIAEVIDKNDEAMEVSTIVLKINMQYPDLGITEESVRKVVQRDKDVFISVGTAGYGLRKWEQEKANIKGGSIRDIIVDFLQASDNPRHISEILDYVRKYRNTSERSVMTNIEEDDSGRFQLFPGSYIGLKMKTYGLETLNYKKINGSHFSAITLKKLNGLSLEAAVKLYEKKHGYTDIQIRHFLNKKINEGVLQITESNKIIA